ncbi:MAG: hypothetical protein U9Q27_03510 [Patescibacteria group bacterium]|nr:hypothetical protein [Patescibacteria group bacterium]
MQIPINYVNGVVVLPGFQILATRNILTQEVTFLDDYEVTFQCAINDNEDKLSHLINEIYKTIGININCPPFSDKIQISKFGTFSGPYGKSNITIYFLKIIHTITFEVKKNYEMRSLSPEKASNEILNSLTTGYHNKSNTHPEYTSVAECVLQRINSYGGIIECIEKDSL